MSVFFAGALAFRHLAGSVSGYVVTLMPNDATGYMAQDAPAAPISSSALRFPLGAALQYLLEPQRFDRVQSRRFSRGVISEEDPNRHREDNGSDNRHRRNQNCPAQ